MQSKITRFIRHLKEDKRLLIIMGLIIIVLGVLIFKTSYAFLKSNISGPASTPIEVNSYTVDELTYTPGNAIVMNFDVGTLTSNVTKNTTSSVKLVKGNNPEVATATATYYGYFNFLNNTFENTISESSPELLLKIVGPDGEITAIPGLEYKTTLGVSGFDIAGLTGKIPLTLNNAGKIIETSSSTTGSTSQYTATIIFVKYDQSQAGNAGKIMAGNLLLQSQKINIYPTTTKGVVTNINEAGFNMEIIAVSYDSAIDHYEYNINGGSWTTSTTKDIVFSNLSPQTSYQIGLRAVDANGNYNNTKYVKVTTKPLEPICPTTGGTLADCIKSQDKVTTGAGLYHHDGSLTNGINDDSYRYAGASADVRNYAKFSGDTTNTLYRIIGVFKKDTENYEVKLIKDISIGNKAWDKKADGTYNNTWSTSTLNVELNTTYLTGLPTNIQNNIATHTWKVGGNTSSNITSQKASTVYQNEIATPLIPDTTSTTGEIEYNAKIGLMYASDYGFATTPDSWTLTMGSYNNATAKANNWLFNSASQWTITRRAGSSDCAFNVNYTGNVGGNLVINDYGVRPVFYLESQALYCGGAGASNNPVIIGLGQCES